MKLIFLDCFGFARNLSNMIFEFKALKTVKTVRNKTENLFSSLLFI